MKLYYVHNRCRVMIMMVSCRYTASDTVVLLALMHKVQDILVISLQI